MDVIDVRLPPYQVMEVMEVIGVGLPPSLRKDDVPVLHVSISMTSGARVHRPWFRGNISASKKLSKRELFPTLWPPTTTILC